MRETLCRLYANSTSFILKGLAHLQIWYLVLVGVILEPILCGYWGTSVYISKLYKHGTTVLIGLLSTHQTFLKKSPCWHFIPPSRWLHLIHLIMSYVNVLCDAMFHPLPCNFCPRCFDFIELIITLSLSFSLQLPKELCFYLKKNLL